MADKNFGVKKLDIIGSGTPTIESPSGGDLNITAATSTFSGHIALGDTKILKLGAAPDMSIFHDGSSGSINLANGSLTTRVHDSNGKGFYIEDPNGGSAETIAKFEKDATSGTGRCELMHGGLKKFETTSSGVTVTGNLSATNVDGAVKVRTDNGNAYHNVLFVDSTTDNQFQTLKMDDEINRLQWNPSAEILRAYMVQSYYMLDWTSGTNGSSGQVLTSQGSGSPWVWATPSSGNIEPAIEVEQRSSNYTTTSSSYQTAITRAIDPTHSSSTLLIVAGGIMSGYRQDYSDDPEKSTPVIQLYRGSTPLGQEMTGGGLPNNTSTGYFHTGFNLTFKDTNNHGGNSVTYYLKIKRDSNSDTQNVQIKTEEQL
tara:strand:- start:407 stop:1519 length:1113 start_codon:yes stop_codon:yes gene_type:complete